MFRNIFSLTHGNGSLGPDAEPHVAWYRCFLAAHLAEGKWTRKRKALLRVVARSGA
jgi:hypothetical protein